MKKISYLAFVLVAMGAGTSNAGYSDAQFRSEIIDGLDIISAERTYDQIPTVAPGELGREVYLVADAVQDDSVQLFIPVSMYMRMGGGLNLGGATEHAQFNGEEYKSSHSWSAQLGLEWNLSSFVRTEIDFQNSVFKFSGLDDKQATYHTVGATLYFDLARRYVQSGDVTIRRTFVPFIGVGAGFGAYEFQGAGGADGAVIAAPRATVGLNIALTNLIGIDIAYQYQMMIGNGFGWNTDSSSITNISNIMASVRAGF